MYGAIRYKRQVKIIEGGRDEVRGEAGVPAVPAHQGGVLAVAVPDLQVVVATVPASLNIKVTAKSPLILVKYNPALDCYRNCSCITLPGGAAMVYLHCRWWG